MCRFQNRFELRGKRLEEQKRLPVRPSIHENASKRMMIGDEVIEDEGIRSLSI